LQAPPSVLDLGQPSSFSVWLAYSRSNPAWA